MWIVNVKARTCSNILGQFSFSLAVRLGHLPRGQSKGKCWFLPFSHCLETGISVVFIPGLLWLLQRSIFQKAPWACPPVAAALPALFQPGAPRRNLPALRDPGAGRGWGRGRPGLGRDFSGVWRDTGRARGAGTAAGKERRRGPPVPAPPGELAAGAGALSVPLERGQPRARPNPLCSGGSPGSPGFPRPLSAAGLPGRVDPRLPGPAAHPAHGPSLTRSARAGTPPKESIRRKRLSEGRQPGGEPAGCPTPRSHRAAYSPAPRPPLPHSRAAESGVKPGTGWLSPAPSPPQPRLSSCSSPFPRQMSSLLGSRWACPSHVDGLLI